MRLMVTGHRPRKLRVVGENWRAVLKGALKDELLRHVAQGPVEAISGMALGVDQLFVEAALEIKDQGEVSVSAYIPFLDFTARWTPEQRTHHERLLGGCDEVVVVSDEQYHPRLYQLRNEAMLMDADGLLAVWDGSPYGGTYNTLRVASDYGFSTCSHFDLLQPDVGFVTRRIDELLDGASIRQT